MLVKTRAGKYSARSVSGQRELWTPRLVAASSILARVVIGVSQLITIPILTSELGESRYAAYVVLASLSSWFALLDCGIGSALQNLLSEKRAHDEDDRDILSAAGVLLIFIAVIAGALFTLFATPLQHFLIGRLSRPTQTEPTWLLLSAGWIFLLTRLTMVAYRVYFAKHIGHWTYLHQAFASIAGLVSLLLLKPYINGPNGLALAIIVTNAPLALWAIWAAARIFPIFSIAQPLSSVYNLAKAILDRSIGFLIFNLMSTVVLAIDYPILSRTLGASEITSYNLLTKAFGQFFIIYAAIQSSFWPLMTERFARQDWGGVQSHIWRLLAIGGAGTLTIATAFSLGGRYIIHILAPSLHVDIGGTTILLCTLYYLVRVWCDTYAVVLQSRSDLATLWTFVPAQAAISIFGQYFLSRRLGINGTFVALTTAFAVTVAHALPRRYWKLRSRDSDMALSPA